MLRRRAALALLLALLVATASLPSPRAVQAQPVVCGQLYGQWSQLPAEHPWESDSIQWRFIPPQNIAFFDGLYTWMMINPNPPADMPAFALPIMDNGRVDFTGHGTDLPPVGLFWWGVPVGSPRLPEITSHGTIAWEFNFTIVAVMRLPNGDDHPLYCTAHYLTTRNVWHFEDGTIFNTAEEPQPTEIKGELGPKLAPGQLPPTLAPTTPTPLPTWTPTAVPTATRRPAGPGRSTPVPGVTPTPAQQNHPTVTPTRTPTP